MGSREWHVNRVKFHSPGDITWACRVTLTYPPPFPSFHFPSLFIALSPIPPTPSLPSSPLLHSLPFPCPAHLYDSLPLPIPSSSPLVYFPPFPHYLPFHTHSHPTLCSTWNSLVLLHFCVFLTLTDPSILSVIIATARTISSATHSFSSVARAYVAFLFSFPFSSFLVDALDTWYFSSANQIFVILVLCYSEVCFGFLLWCIYFMYVFLCVVLSSLPFFFVSVVLL